MIDPEDDEEAGLEPAEIELLYVGKDPVRVPLRDGRAALFSLERPQKRIPAADARDLLTPAIGGGRFLRVGGA
jgi:ADP-ribose pyrophosphatase YjhB (NUDIX family)